MNIFALHSSPQIAAKYAANKHVVKMALESVQILSSVWRYIKGINKDIILPDGKIKIFNILPNETYSIFKKYHFKMIYHNKQISKVVYFKDDEELEDKKIKYIEKLYSKLYSNITYKFISYSVKYNEDTQKALSITHINHPSTVWARSGAQQYNWLIKHTYALENEWKIRFNHPKNNRHKSVKLIDNFPKGEDILNNTKFTLPTPVMPDKYKIYYDNNISVVDSYRFYYINEKANMGINKILWKEIYKKFIKRKII